MKKYVWLIALIWAFVSCDSEEPDLYPDHGDYPWNLGYFIGTVGGEDICVENTPYSRKRDDIHCAGLASVYYGGVLMQDAISWGAPFQRSDTLSYGISIVLTPIKEGVFEIIDDKDFDPSQSSLRTNVTIYKRYSKGNNIYYRQQRSSLLLQLDSVRYDLEHTRFPFFYGKMDGVLYNTEDSRDSIIIKGVRFGGI